MFKALILVALFGIVGVMDYEDEQNEQARYCENVQNGVWPDYKGTYKNYCKESQKSLDEVTTRI